MPKIFLKSFLGLFVSLFLAAVSCFANTYYVSTSGNDANDGSTLPTAWRDITYAVSTNILLAGDSIIVAPGTYVESTIAIAIPVTLVGPNAGIPGNGVRGPEAIVQASYGDPEEGRIFDLQTSNVVIDGFTMDGSSPSSLPGYSYTVGTVNVYQSAAVSNGDPYDSPDMAYQFDHFTFQNNIVQDMSYQGLYLQVSFGSNHSENYFNNNLFDNMWEGIQTYALQADVSNNVFVDVNRGLSMHAVNVPADLGFIPQVINNTISIATSPSPYTVDNTGIWINYRRQNAPALSVSNNVVNFTPGIPPGTECEGLIVYTVDGGRVVTFANNTINGNNLCNQGMRVWACDSTSVVTLSNGAMNGITDYGVVAINSTDYGFGDAYITVNGEAIQMASSGIGMGISNQVPTNNCSITVNGGVQISGGAVGVDANNGIVNIQNSSIFSNVTGILVENNGTETGYFNNIYGNSYAGVDNTLGSATVLQEYDWWNSADGPQPTGSGDLVMGNVYYPPWSVTTIGDENQAIPTTESGVVAFDTAQLNFDFSSGTAGSGGNIFAAIGYATPTGANLISSRAFSKEWNINTDMIGYSVCLVFQYNVSDIPAGVPEDELIPAVSVDGGNTWHAAVGTVTNDTVGHSVTLCGVTSVGMWTLVQQGYVDLPVAGFYGTPTSWYDTLTVQFTDTTLNNPTSWAWDFGDGVTTTVQNPLHVYASVGYPTTYTVQLIATNAYGSSTVTAVNYITILEPLLTITANPSLGGSVSPSSGYYVIGTTISCLATPNGGYAFTGWTGDLSGTVNPQTLLMDTDKNVTANFVPLVNVSVFSNPSGENVIIAGNSQTAPYSFVTTQGSSFTINAPSPQLDTTGFVRYVFNHWDDGGAQSHSVTPGSDTSFTVSFDTQYYFTGVADSTLGYVTPTSGWYAAGTTLAVQANPTTGYGLLSWSGSLSGDTNPQSLLMNNYQTVTATFAPLINITFYSNPSGLNVNVNGTDYATPYAFSTTSSSCFTIIGDSPQSGGPGVQFVFDNWDDGGAMSHTVCPASDSTFTVSFDTQYLLTIAANPSLDGSVSPSSGWYAAGTTLTCLATPNGGFGFIDWTGDLGGPVNPQSLLMDTAKNVTANFATLVNVTVYSNPSGQTVIVNGTNETAPYGFVTTAGSCFTISVITTQAGDTGTQYIFDSWDDGGLTTHTVCPTSDTSYTAIFDTQYYLSLVANPSTAGTFNQSSGWYYSGTTLNLQAIATAGYVFSNWTGDVNGFDNPTTIIMDTYKNITADFIPGVMITVYANVSGATLVIDGLLKVAPYSFVTSVGACFDLNAVTPQSPGAGTQYQFVSWSDGGGDVHTVCVPEDTTFTAYFDTQYYLTTQVNPAGSGIVSPPSGWYSAYTTLSCLATPGLSRVFTGWSGDLGGTVNPQDLVMDTSKTITANFSTTTVTYLISGYVYSLSSTFTEVGSVIAPNFAYNVAVNGNYAYLADYTNGLQVVDVSNASSPTIVGSVGSPGQAQSVAVNRNYAYLADGYSGLRIDDVSNPTAPVEVGYVDTLGYTWDVALQGNYAYLADWSKGLEVVNISTASNPVIVGNYVTAGLAYGVAVQGNYAYVADGSAGLRIIDISNPSSPMEVSSYNTTGFVLSVAVSGNYAYVADDSSGLRIVDISNPTNPVEVGVSGTPGSATDVTVNGNFAYLADGMVGLRVFDVADPTTPFDIGTVSTGGNAVGINAQGPFLYVADGSGGLEIIQIGVPLAGVTMTMSGDTSQTTVTNTNGYYQFVNYPNGDYTVTPSKSPYYFSPTNRSYTFLSADQYNQNYVVGTTMFVTINAPSNLNVVVGSPTELDLLWVSNSNNESGFGILREVNGGSWSLVTTVPAGQISYADENLIPGDNYCYKVYAFNGFNQSGYSNEACETLPSINTTILTPYIVKLPDVKLFINQTLSPAFDMTLFNTGSPATTASIVSDFLGVSSLYTSYNGSNLTTADISYTGYATATVVSNNYSLANFYGSITAGNLLKYSTYKINKLPKIGLNPGETYFLNVANYTFDTTGPVLADANIPPSFGNVSALIVSDSTLVSATWSGTTGVNITLIGSSPSAAVSVDVIASPNPISPFDSDMDKERVYVYTNLLSQGTFNTAMDTSGYGLELAPGDPNLATQSWIANYTDSAGTLANGVWQFGFADTSTGVKATPFPSNYITLSTGQWYTSRMRFVADSPNAHQAILFGFSNLVGAGIQTDIAAQVLFGVPTVWTWLETPFFSHSNSTDGYPQFQFKAGNAGAIYIDEIQLIQAAPTLVDSNRYLTRLFYPYGTFDDSSDTVGWGQQVYIDSTASPTFSVASGNLLLDFSGAASSPGQLGLKWTANNASPGTVYTVPVNPPQQVGVRLTLSIESGVFDSLGIVLVAEYGVQTSGEIDIGGVPGNLIAAAEIGTLTPGDVRTVGQAIDPYYQFQFGVRSDLPGILGISNVDFDMDNDNPNYGDGSLFP